MNEVQVETTTMKAFGETIPRLVETVDIQILKSVHNKLVKPTLQPVQEGINGGYFTLPFPAFLLSSNHKLTSYRGAHILYTLN